MTLPEKLLQELNDWKPLGEGRHSWVAAFPAEGWSVHLATDKADSLACLVWDLALKRIEAPPGGLTLAAWAAAVADRVEELGQPLKVYEIDETRGEAVLRSASPAARGDALTYHEVRLAGLSTATVRRYTASKIESGRSQISFPLTHEHLAALAGRLAS